MWLCDIGDFRQWAIQRIKNESCIMLLTLHFQCWFCNWCHWLVRKFLLEVKTVSQTPALKRQQSGQGIGTRHFNPCLCYSFYFYWRILFSFGKDRSKIRFNKPNYYLYISPPILNFVSFQVLPHGWLDPPTTRSCLSNA